MISDAAILKKISLQPKHSAGFKQLVRELGLHGDERQALDGCLTALVARGELTQDGDRYALPKPPGKNEVMGRLSMHRDGYGFVIPESASLREKLSGDIYIPPPAIGDAMHGDRVLVEVKEVREGGRAEGRILRVIGRAHPTVVGIFHYGSRHNYVTPFDEKITADVVIPRGAEVPSDSEQEVSRKATQSRHRVVGGEARRREVKWDDLEGVVVDVAITDWPTPTQSPRGRVVEILGYQDDFGVDVEIIIRKHHLPHRFPIDVLEEAQAAEKTIPGHELRSRRDYRNLPIVTIDGETARDFDDAVFVRRRSNGNFELQVHIADVARYVREGTALDGEARLRGNSVYFPDRAVPMLPVELSTDICSLRPNLDRLVLSCTMEIDHRGEVVGYEINPGVIRSAERMTYTDVNALLEGDSKLRERYHRLVDVFELMRELAMLLNRKRVRRGSIDFDLPEPFIEFDEFGIMKAITRSERNFAHRLIEEFMLAANESVASYLEQKDVASLYRIHEKPDPKRVLEFETVAAAFGYSLGVGNLPVKKFRYTDDRRPRNARGQRSRSGQSWREVEIPEDIRITPHMYQKLTEKIAGKPEERILSYLMLRSLKQARYSERNAGHFALAAPTYTHFTSPIRRYPDLIVHRILKEVLAEGPERRDEEVPVGVGEPVDRPYDPDAAQTSAPAKHSSDSPWSKGKHAPDGHRARGRHAEEEPSARQGPIPEDALHDIAEESSQSERHADDAERELLEWKKIKFMLDRVGEDFQALIISVTKFGFFVELTDLFIEGLVPLSTLTGDLYTFHENTRQIIGQRTKKRYSLGDSVHVLLDRIDHVQRKLQFAVIDDAPPLLDPRRRKSSH
jgi:ribonuclease R